MKGLDESQKKVSVQKSQILWYKLTVCIGNSELVHSPQVRDAGCWLADEGNQMIQHSHLCPKQNNINR